MSRKRDTNWTRDEITVLLDSIMEITKMRDEDGRRTNSREVFEYAAKKMGEKGHPSRAEREKCRTKWKKMKEEFTHAKRARETGEGRVAPGIEPFYTRMLEFNNGNFHNISPHSTIVRRSSSISSNINNISNSSNSNQNNLSVINNINEVATTPGSSSALASSTTNLQSTTSTTPTPNSYKVSHNASRASARIAASTNGTLSNDTSSTIVTRQTNASGSDYSSAGLNLAEPSPSLRQNSRANTTSTNGSDNGAVKPSSNGLYHSLQNTTTVNNQAPHSHQQNHNHLAQGTTAHQQLQSQQTIPNGETSNPLYNSYNKHNSPLNADDNNSSLQNSSNGVSNHLQTPDRDADISYRVSTGCRQITIFGDHDVDIKFRGDCVTINKINSE